MPTIGRSDREIVSIPLEMQGACRAEPFFAPGSPEPGKGDKGKDVDDLLKDINKKAGKDKGNETQPVDAVDPQYQGKSLSDGRKVGALRTRQSLATVDVAERAVIEPGGVSV